MTTYLPLLRNYGQWVAPHSEAAQIGINGLLIIVFKRTMNLRR